MFIGFYLFYMFFSVSTPNSHSQDWKASSQTSRSTPNFYGFTLEKLDSFGKFNTSSLMGKESLWVLFQPDCKSCEAQLNDLSCLKDIETLAVGFWGTKENLNHRLRFSRFKGSKLMASKNLEEKVQLKLTPTLLLIRKNGSLIEKFLAKVPCQKIKEKLEGTYL